MRVVRVPLGDRSYRILIGPDLLGRLGAYCRQLGLGSRCAVISDTHVAPLYAESARRALESARFHVGLVAIPAGEKAKSIRTVERCYEQLAAFRLERKSFIVALGEASWETSLGS